MTTPTTVSVRLQLRADTAANWTSANPTLLANELGRETDTGKIKIGDGSTAWSSLAYQAWATLPIAVASGGTGQTSYTNGQLLIGNTTGNTLTKATLTAGSGIAITNGTGSITVAASGISDAQIAADAEIAVSKLADGTARQLLQTDAAGTGVEWASNIDIPGTLDVTSTATFDSIASHPLGAAATPSITFTGDTNTGIYSPGADQVSVATGGTERLRIDSTGQIESVSLGTAAAPTYSFTTDPNTGIYSPGADQLAISTNGTNRFQIDSSGNITVDTNTFYVDAANNRVGIGTTSPGANLHVATIGNAEVLIGGTQTPLLNFVGGAGSDPVIGYAVGALRFGTITGAGAAGFSEKARLDTSGRLLVGTSTARSNFFNTSGYAPQFQIEGANNSGVVMMSITSGDASLGPYINLARQKSGTIGGNTAVANNDILGNIAFQGNDGTEFVEGATIVAAVDGTPGANDMPTRLVFSTTADGASSPTEAMRINNQREVLIGTNTRTANGGVLQVSNGITFPATQSACSDPNTLDDYEEGSCTITLSDSSGNSATMGAGNVFQYRKIGSFVLVSGTLVWSSTSALLAGSRIRLTGLPFAGSGTTDMRWPAIFGSSSSGSFLITRSEIGFGLDFGNSFIWGTKVFGNNVDGNLTKADLGSSGVLYGILITYNT